MPPDGDAGLAADELESLSFGSSERSRSASTATASCSTSSSGPLPPRATTPSAAVPLLGTVALSDIRFVRRLGAGDIGSVYLAEVKGKGDSTASALVAAKVMDRKELEGRNKEGRARTEREILEAVDHPFLPRLYGVAEDDRSSCLLTEFCPGGDLHVLRQRQQHRRFSEAAVRRTTMPKIKTSGVKYPDGWELIEPTLLELQAKMREAENDPHDGKRKCEALWPIFKINHQRSRYLYDLYYSRKDISQELYEFCLDQGHADRSLIAKWKKPGYERLCCLHCIQTRDHNFATTCVCRVPKHLREEQIIECVHCGCKGCASGD